MPENKALRGKTNRNDRPQTAPQSFGDRHNSCELQTSHSKTNLKVYAVGEKNTTKRDQADVK